MWHISCSATRLSRRKISGSCLQVRSAQCRQSAVSGGKALNERRVRRRRGGAARALCAAEAGRSPDRTAQCCTAGQQCRPNCWGRSVASSTRPEHAARTAAERPQRTGRECGGRLAGQSRRSAVRSGTLHSIAEVRRACKRPHGRWTRRRRTRSSAPHRGTCRARGADPLASQSTTDTKARQPGQVNTAGLPRAHAIVQAQQCGARAPNSARSGAFVHVCA